MKFKIFVTLLVSFLSLGLMAQDKAEQLSGKVSFVTSNSIYVKFKDTQQIAVGDTLQLLKNGANMPCLLVKQKSSTSCVCEPVNECEVSKEDAVVFNYFLKVETVKEVEEEVAIADIEEQEAPIEEVPSDKKTLFEEKIRGRISAASYSNISPTSENRHRMMYRFSLNAANINNSKFSLESYINYRQNFLPQGDVSGRQTKFFRVYNLAVRYDMNPTTSLTIGRKINSNASSIGAIDGLQVEKHFGNYYAGILAGFRPDIFDYGLNTNLLQYGAYFGNQINNQNIRAKTTLGFFEQRNGGGIDRRYAYLQHSSTIHQKLNLFGSFEADLYQSINGQAVQNIRLSNLYVSARYRFSRKFDVNLSYDARKRILYYETFKTEIEQMLEDDISRQGIRLRANVKPLKYINLGASYSMRFQSDQQNKSNNINGFMSLSRVPSIGGRLSVNFNNNQSNYLNSNILSFRYSCALIKKKLDGDFYVRTAQYNYLNSELTSTQQYYGANLSYRLSKKLTFSILGELASSTSRDNYRVNAKIVKRFDSKKKKQ
ncbi:MAG: hypothetical protein R3E32_20250 [Chitinophagales bacterium]